MIQFIRNILARRTFAYKARNKAMNMFSSYENFKAIRETQETKRQKENRPHEVLYFHKVDDPYSHLTIQYIDKFINGYDINLKPILVGEENPVTVHEPDLYDAYCLQDVKRIAPFYDVDFEALSYPSKNLISLANSILCNLEAEQFTSIAKEVSSALWLGQEDKLKELGIDIVQELKGVGENLQDHLMFRPIYKIQGLKSLNKKVNSLFGKLMIGLEYVFNRSGPMTMGASQMCMFAKSDPSLELPDLQWHVQPMSMDTLGATKNHDFHAFTPTVSNIRPTSRGHVSIVDKDSRTYAKIKMNYLSTDHDRMIAARGLKLTRKIVMESETFKKYKPEEYRPGIDINDDEELVKAGSDFAQTIFHPVGTCKMGQDDMAVVDEKLKVKGIENLRVIDASIMPNITSGNTNAPTIMIAEKGADMILTH